MAQLIKLQDFISRYETDIYRYPSQFLRLKKSRWDGIKREWYNGTLQQVKFGALPVEFGEYREEEWDSDDWLSDGRKSIFSSVKSWFSKNKNKQEDSYFENDFFSASSEFQRTEERRTLEDIKLEFLDELLRFQIMWASSTLRERSLVNQSYYYDPILRFLLQEFPDNYLVLYNPILQIKNAPVELEIILISPTTTWCMTVLESREKESDVFRVDKGRYWIEGYGEEERKRINPTISLNRMYRIVHSIYEQMGVDLPIKKIVLTRQSFIEGAHASTDTLYVDRLNFEEWHGRMKRMPSPLKHVQLKAAQALLNFSQSTYIKRPEWEEEDEHEQDREDQDDSNTSSL
ncbi:NERD domain-containing protein [Bacillus tianshenii]|nr:NERD domain-containing protein [Bacillus tianshenii]